MSSSEKDSSLPGGVGIGFDLGVGSLISHGFGLGGFYPLPAHAGIRATLPLSDNWRLEPRIGGGFERSKNRMYSGSGADRMELGEQTVTWWNSGVGFSIERGWTASDSVRLQTGVSAVAGYGQMKRERRNDDQQVEGQVDAVGPLTTRSLAFGVGPVLGGEYYLSRNLSVGFKAGLRVQHVRTYGDGGDASRPRTQSWSVGHQTGLIVRLYP